MWRWFDHIVFDTPMWAYVSVCGVLVVVEIVLYLVL